MLAIFSHQDDLHALLAREELEKRHKLTTFVVESNLLHRSDVTEFCLQDRRCVLKDRDRGAFDLFECKTIWTRRTQLRQKLNVENRKDYEADLINNDCREALTGMILSAKHADCVNDILASRRAENKLLQLAIAEQAGMLVPRTLLTQSSRAVSEFFNLEDGKIILKSVSGTRLAPTVTQLVDQRHLAAIESIRISPTLYQEYIPGDLHLRVNVFGERAFCFGWKTSEVDARVDFSQPPELVELDAKTDGHIKKVLAAFGLKMGIFDLKVRHDGRIVFLEVNPQGQFLFLEGMTGFPLMRSFCEFLAEVYRSA